MRGKLKEKLRYPSKEYLDAYLTALHLNTRKDEAEPLYRLHASRLKLLRNNQFTDFELLEKYNFVKEGEEMKPVSSAVESVQKRRILIENSLQAMKECHNIYPHFHKNIYQLALQHKLDGQLQKAKECYRNLFGEKKTTKVFCKVYRFYPDRGGKIQYYIRKHSLLYIELLGRTRDINTLEIMASFATKKKEASEVKMKIFIVYLGLQRKILSEYYNKQMQGEMIDPAIKDDILRRAWEIDDEIKPVFQDIKVEAVELLLDAYKFYNNINHQVSIQEVRRFCKKMWTKSGKKRDIKDNQNKEKEKEGSETNGSLNWDLHSSNASVFSNTVHELPPSLPPVDNNNNNNQNSFLLDDSHFYAINQQT
jgi:hypothetical protein